MFVYIFYDCFKGEIHMLRFFRNYLEFFHIKFLFFDFSSLNFTKFILDYSFVLVLYSFVLEERREGDRSCIIEYIFSSLYEDSIYAYVVVNQLLLFHCSSIIFILARICLFVFFFCLSVCLSINSN